MKSKTVIEEFFSKTDRYRGVGKVNAPTFIYKILYGKMPSHPIRGIIQSEDKLYKGIPVDKNIPNKALDQLNKIKEIEIRSSCEGHNEERPTFLIIRLIEKDEKKYKNFVKIMNSFSDIKCDYDIGNMGEYRIGITTPLFYEKDPEKFTEWWITLPNKIKKSL